MHWDQMTDTTEDLRRRATRLRRGVGQLGVLESIIEVADGPWLGAMDADGRGAAELRMHLVGRYRLTAVVTSLGKLSHVQMNAPVEGLGAERVISAKTALRKGWDENEKMPKPAQWLDYVVEWVSNASQSVDRRAIIEWRLKGADRQLAAMNDTIEIQRANLIEREQERDVLAAEIAELRGELRTLTEELAARIAQMRGELESLSDGETVSMRAQVAADAVVADAITPEVEASGTERAAAAADTALPSADQQAVVRAEADPTPTEDTTATAEVEPTSTEHAATAAAVAEPTSTEQPTTATAEAEPSTSEHAATATVGAEPTFAAHATASPAAAERTSAEHATLTRSETEAAGSADDISRGRGGFVDGAPEQAVAGGGGGQ
ncbi:hypothetical protein [Nocardia sp. NPDC050406]|uniref:hypothetical protein n=1 Tax=Nocardia sp. NPDC050406 TaxID=3364318 RepID=UPI00378CB66F